MTAHPVMFNSAKALRRILFISFTASVLSGCSADERVNTASVLANANCKGTNTGLSEVSLADVARFRGSQLLVPESNEAESLATQVPTNTDGAAPMPLFISLSRGAQPSRGFELHLADQARVVGPTELSIDVYWSEPDTSKPQPLVTTTPCLVVSVPNGPWQTIGAIDQHGKSLGTLTRSPTP